MFSVRVLNHNWDPNESYNLFDSWVAKIKEIRGNSPRNVCYLVPSVATCAHWPLSQDLGECAMVFLWR